MKSSASFAQTFALPTIFLKLSSCAVSLIVVVPPPPPSSEFAKTTRNAISEIPKTINVTRRTGSIPLAFCFPPPPPPAPRPLPGRPLDCWRDDAGLGPRVEAAARLAIGQILGVWRVRRGSLAMQRDHAAR
jgi:hypothetical protein